MHQHSCEVAGHLWDCGGIASRPLSGQSEPSVCLCLQHGVPMEEGDHSQFSIELLACPLHRDDQLRAMGYEPGTSHMPQPITEQEEGSWTGRDGNPIVGFCLWCDRDFYFIDEHEAHVSEGMKECAEFQAFKAKQASSPPDKA
jgi:hypothetical protein